MESQFELLIKEGEELLERGILLVSEESQQWTVKCNHYLMTKYGKNSKEHKGFKGDDISSKVMTLKVLNEPSTKTDSDKQHSSYTFNLNQIQSQTTSIKNDISFQILLNIDHSNDLTEEEKEEAKGLFNNVKNECEKTETNWSKVTSLLKKSFDYGLKIAPDIVKLADAYYRAKG